MRFNQWTQLCDIMPQTCGIWQVWTVFQRSSDFKFFLFFSLHYKLFQTNQNAEKTLSILMALQLKDAIQLGKQK